MVHNWYKEFHFSRTTFEDSNHCGHPMTVASEHNVAKVNCVIKEDRRITENETKNSLKLSSGSLDWILLHHLGVQKYCTRLVPHKLTEE